MRKAPVNTEQESWWHGPSNWVLGGLLLIAFGMWIFQLDAASLWRDEGLTVARSDQSLATIFANRNLVQDVSSPDLHPPLYFLMLSGWLQVAGRSEFSIRFPSLVAMVLALAMFIAVGRRIWGRASGAWTVLPVILSPFILWYAQEARMYAWVVLESLILLYLLWDMMQRRVGWIGHLKFGLAALALMYTHYSGVFLLAFAALAYSAARLEKRAWWRVALVLGGIGVVAIPLYPNILELVTASGFIAFSRRSPWTLLKEAANTFTLGSAGPAVDPGWRLIAPALLGVVGALTLDVTPRRQRRQACLIGAGGFLVTLLLFYLGSWIQANYSNPRHLITLSPFWFLLIGHGLATLSRRLWPVAVLIGLIMSTSGAMAIYQTIADPPIVRDNVRGLTRYIKERARPGDAIVWHDAVMMTTYDYYALDLPYTALPRYGDNDKARTLESLAQWTQPYKRIWFVSHPSAPYFDQSIIPSWLRERMVRLDMVSFPASWTTLWLQLYRPPHLLEALPAKAQAVNVKDGPYRVRGIAAESETEAGKGMWLSVYWAVEGEPSPEPPSACVQIVDSHSTIWSQGCAALNMPLGQAPSVGTLTEQQLWLPLPEGLAPVPYKAELILGNEVQAAGSLHMQRPAEAPVHSAIARYADDLELVDLAWSAEEFQAGLWAIGDLLWRIESAPCPDLKVTVRLVDWLGRSVAEHVGTVGPPDYPSQEWQPGELVRSRVALGLPFDAEGSYRVQVAVNGPDGRPVKVRGVIQHRWASAGWVPVSRWPMVREVPEHVEQHLTDVDLGSTIHLVGYDLERDDRFLTVDLYWERDPGPAENYGVFVHVGQPGEPPLAQSSGGPAEWARPVESWRPGEIILDSHTIQLPADLGSGDASILVGMYELDQPAIRLPMTADSRTVTGNSLMLGPLP